MGKSALSVVQSTAGEDNGGQKPVRQQLSLREHIQTCCRGCGKALWEGCKAIFKLDHQMPVGNGDVREKQVSREHSVSAAEAETSTGTSRSNEIEER